MTACALVFLDDVTTLPNALRGSPLGGSLATASGGVRLRRQGRDDAPSRPCTAGVPNASNDRRTRQPYSTVAYPIELERLTVAATAAGIRLRRRPDGRCSSGSPRRSTGRRSSPRARPATAFGFPVDSDLSRSIGRRGDAARGDDRLRRGRHRPSLGANITVWQSDDGGVHWSASAPIPATGDDRTDRPVVVRAGRGGGGRSGRRDRRSNMRRSTGRRTPSTSSASSTVRSEAPRATVDGRRHGHVRGTDGSGRSSLADARCRRRIHVPRSAGAPCRP